MRYWEIKEAEEKKIVAVMPGGFHPFHPGHKSLYDWAVKTFGQDNVFVAATNDTKSRPFPFDIKQKLNKPKNNFNMGTYTIEHEKKNLQISGPILQNWYFILSKKS